MKSMGKKIIFALVLLLAVYQGWDWIAHGFFPAQPTAAVAPRNEVVLYATQWCPYCQRTRQFFKDNGITYTEWDVETSAEGARRYRELGGTRVPLVTVNDTIIRGYSPEGIRAALR
jgi:glutaredoxin